MRVAVVGSREFSNPGKVRRFVQRLPRGTVIVTGGARGVDSWAEDEALRNGLKTDVYLADWDQFGKSAGFRRNVSIVEAADVLVAFWDGASRGTQHSVNLAQDRGLPTFVVEADGTFPTYEELEAR